MMKEHVIKLTWHPIKGNLYKVEDLGGHRLSLEPKAKFYYYQKHSYALDDKRLYLNKDDIFLFLGEKQRIPEYYSFFKILNKDLVCWLIMPERLYEQKHKIINPIPLL